jgi:uncharacterized protein (TIGR02646 family)
MYPMSRGPAPDCLLESQASWTTDWIARVSDDTKQNDFSWRSEGCRVQIKATLLAATDERCSFCDSHPVLSAEINYFKLKLKFPALAYEWLNLFACCSSCNKSKGDDPGIALRPDANDYSFGRYFLRDLDDSFVANPAASADDQARAEATISFLKLNRPDLRRARAEHAAGHLRPYRF